ncbi:MAG: HAD hydrolase-like protein [Candidatus Nitrosocaldaceae archaeon]
MLKILSLDLDGTIFPNNIDDKLWFELIPREISKAKGISIDAAISFAKTEYNRLTPYDPRWYIPEYWLERFMLNIDLNSLLNEMEYDKYIYQDLNSINYGLKVIVSTTNARSVLYKKLDAIKKIIPIDASFSVVSDLNIVNKNRRFYEHICNVLNVKPYEIMHIGDNIIYDLLYARSCGLRSILIDRGKSMEGYDVIHTFDKLAEYIRNNS